MLTLPNSVAVAPREMPAAASQDLLRHMASQEVIITRSHVGRDVMAAVSTAFQELTGTFNPDSLRQLASRSGANFYAPGQIAPLVEWLKLVVVNGGAVLLQGAVHGVGSTTFVTDFARAWNFWAEKHRVAERVAYLDLGAHDTPKQLFDHLGETVGLSITPGEYRRKSPARLARDFIAATIRARQTTVILDHPERVKPEVFSSVLDLMDASQPQTFVPAQTEAYEQWLPRVAFVLVSNAKLGSIARDSRVPRLLTMGKVEMKIYEDDEILGEAIRRAGPAFSMVDVIADPGHRQVVHRIRTVTLGRVSLIAPLLQLMDVIAQHSDKPVLSMETLRFAERFGRDLREATFRRKDPAFPDADGTSAVVLDRPSGSEATVTHPKRPARNRREEIRLRRMDQDRAHSQNRALRRSARSVPEGM